ncbi:MAG: methyltransferase domain-containing protein [Pseudomonadota bacterium]
MLTVDFNYLDLKPGQRILDIGCGEGRHTAGACDQSKVFCVGADMNPDDLVTSRKRLELHTRLSGSMAAWALAAADITGLPFADSSFDTLICSEVLEHIPHDAMAMAELNRVLKPGGCLAVSVPRQWPESICWCLSSDYGNVPPGHIRIYRKKQLIRQFTDFGFSLTRVHYAHSLHAPYWWLKCLVGLDNTRSVVVNAYHRFLVWDMMKKPRITRIMDRILNPILGKSVVLYFTKPVP